MATQPCDTPQIIERFGPHRAYLGGDRLETSIESDRLVKTHCCFCGQQCGMQLKVRNNEVIGVEPWEEFPVNRGMMCTKGVKRYLQNAHPDRLLNALVRDTGTAGGFRPLTYEAAIAQVAAEIQRIQDAYGSDAFAVLSGASLTVEKGLPDGQICPCVFTHGQH